MKTRSLILASIASSLALALAQGASAQTIQAGQGQIDQALQTIVPQKFEVALDDMVPRDLKLSWSESPNWMVALLQATKKAGLQVIPDWNANVLKVMLPVSNIKRAPSPEAAPAIVAQAAASAPAVVPASAPVPAAAQVPVAPAAVAAAAPSPAPSPAPAVAASAPIVASPAAALTAPAAKPQPVAPFVQLVETPAAELRAVTVSARAEHQPLVSASVESAAPVAPVVVPVAPVAPLRSYKALLTDRNLRGVVNRWAKEQGMQEVVWQLASADIPVDREVTFSDSFEDALRGLMRATSYTGQPARACLHSNEVVRVIPRTQFCSQP